MKRDEAGYTILEALVALAILAVVLVALFSAAGTSLGAIQAGAQSRALALLAQSKLDEAAAMRDPLPPTSGGIFPGTDIAWRLDAGDLPQDGAAFGDTRLQEVRLALSRPGEHGARTIILATRHLGIVRR